MTVPRARERKFLERGEKAFWDLMKWEREDATGRKVWVICGGQTSLTVRLLSLHPLATVQSLTMGGTCFSTFLGKYEEDSLMRQ